MLGTDWLQLCSHLSLARGDMKPLLFEQISKTKDFGTWLIMAPLALEYLVMLSRIAHRFDLASLECTDCECLVCAEKHLLEHVDFLRETLLGYSLDKLEGSM